MATEQDTDEDGFHSHTLQEYLTYAAGGLAAAWFLPEIILTLDPFQYLLFKHAWVLGLPVILFAVLTFLQRRSKGQNRLVNSLLSAVGALITVAAISMTLFILGLQPTFILAIIFLSVLAFILSRSFSNWILTNVSEPMILAAVMLGLFMVFLGTGRVREVEKRDIALEELRAAGMDYNLEALQTTIFFLNDRGLGLYREAGFSEDDIDFALNQTHELTGDNPLIAGVIERLHQTLEDLEDPAEAARQTFARTRQFGDLFKLDQDAGAESVRSALFQEKFRFSPPTTEATDAQLTQKKVAQEKQSVVGHIVERYAGSRLYFGLISNFQIGFYNQNFSDSAGNGPGSALSEEQTALQRKAFAATIDPFLPLLLEPAEPSMNTELVCRALSELAWPARRPNSLVDRARSLAAQLRGDPHWVARPTSWRPIGSVIEHLSTHPSNSDTGGTSIATCVQQIDDNFTPSEGSQLPNIDAISASGIEGFVIYKSPDIEGTQRTCRIAEFAAKADEAAPGLFQMSSEIEPIAFTGIQGELEGMPLIGAIQEHETLGSRLKAMPLPEAEADRGRDLAPFAVSWGTNPLAPDRAQSTRSATSDIVVTLGRGDSAGDTDAKAQRLAKNLSAYPRAGDASVRYQTVNVRFPDDADRSDTIKAMSDVCLELTVKDEDGLIDRSGVYIKQDEDLAFALPVKGGSNLTLLAASRDSFTPNTVPIFSIEETSPRNYPPVAGAFRRTAQAAIANQFVSSDVTKYSGEVGAEEEAFLAFEVTELTQLNIELTGMMSDIDVELLRIVDQTSFNEIASSTSGGTEDESISAVLDAGTYLIRTYSFDGASRFVLSLATDTEEVEILGPLSDSAPQASASGMVIYDISKLYTVIFDTAGLATFTLKGLSADVDITVRDANQVELNSSSNSDTDEELISIFVEPGSYFVELDPFTSSSVYELEIALEPN